MKYYVTDILLFDIVGFSKLSNDDQFITASIITEKLKETTGILMSQTFLERHEVVLGFIPTGDGFYVILQPEFAGYGVFLAISVRSSILLASKQMDNLFTGVKSAVHLGYAILFTDITGNENYVGDGLNDCARLLCASVEKSPTEGIPTDENYIIVSTSAYDQFEKVYPQSDQILSFFNAIDFGKSDRFSIVDKHGKEHHAYFIECSRHVAIKPPPPPDLNRRMQQFLQRLKNRGG